MRLIKIRTLLLALFIGFGAVFIALGLLGETSSVLAQGQALSEQGNKAVQMQPPPPNDDDLKFVAYFTDDFSVEITNLAGIAIGEGLHRGQARCNKNTCSQKTELDFTFPFTDPDYIGTYEYKFKQRVAFDPDEASAVVAGTGTISRRGQNERFTFTAIFQDNRDGTVSATYVASRPDASFRIPRSPGTFIIGGRP